MYIPALSVGVLGVTGMLVDWFTNLTIALIQWLTGLINAAWTPFDTQGMADAMAWWQRYDDWVPLGLWSTLVGIIVMWTGCTVVMKYGSKIIDWLPFTAFVLAVSMSVVSCGVASADSPAADPVAVVRPASDGSVAPEEAERSDPVLRPGYNAPVASGVDNAAVPVAGNRPAVASPGKPTDSIYAPLLALPPQAFHVGSDRPIDYRRVMPAQLVGAQPLEDGSPSATDLDGFIQLASTGMFSVFQKVGPYVLKVVCCLSAFVLVFSGVFWCVKRAIPSGESS